MLHALILLPVIAAGPGPMIEIPAGPFLMGSARRDREALKRERPQRQVTLPRFFIDRLEVTNAEYERCRQAGRCGEARRVGGKTKKYYAGTSAPGQPVVGVTFKDAQDYCAFAGKRLPTELEWEKAARGTDGRIYPWGDEAPTCERANDQTCGMVARPPGSLPGGASPYGVLDMAGNVIEWTSTPYRADLLKTLNAERPAEPKGRGWRVIRGGSWGSYPRHVRSAFRRAWDPKNAGHTIGLRCARPSPPSP